MSCPTELNLLLYADRELSAADVPGIEGHVAACPRCRARVDALRAEAAVLAAALAHAEQPMRVPDFERPASRLALAIGISLFLLVAAVIAAAPTLVDVTLPTPLTWFDPLDAVNLLDMAVGVGIYLAERGGALMTSLSELAAAAAIVGLLAWIALRWRRNRSAPLLLALAACALLVLPSPSHALDFRRSEHGTVLIPAGETIDDTLVAFGETVEVNGDVEGDLIAAARRVVIRGQIGGQVITAAENVTIAGRVTNSVVAFARAIEVLTPALGGNLFAFGAEIDTGQQTTIDGNAVLFGERNRLAGPVGKDVVAFAEQLEVGSSVGGGLMFFGNQLRLLAPARITGNVTARVPDDDHVSVSPGAVIGGEVKTEIMEHPEPDSDYTSFGYYGGQVLRFAAAFLTGLVVLALLPGLRRLRLDTGANLLVAGGVGLVTLVAVPVIAVIVGLTLIGLPLALLALLVWLAAIYLSKVVLAHLIGARILDAANNPRHFTVALLVGLLAVIILVELPFIGGLLNFLLTICGLGLLVLFGWRGYRREPAAGAV